MQIDCPSCRHAIEIEDTDQSGVTLCPSCGSSVSFLDPTVDFPRPEVQYVDQFRLLHQLGEGQFGTVWKAQDEQLRRTVALKLPRRSEVTDEIERMFLREAQAAAALEHPNIVRVYEVGKDDDQIFIASEFIDGSTLKEYARTESLGIEKIASIMETVARAMHSAHEAGIVHRDLKPANILMDRQGRPYITDFGIAKQTASQLTHTATFDAAGDEARIVREESAEAVWSPSNAKWTCLVG